MKKTLAYYPGCSLHGTASELDSSFLAGAAALGLVMREIPDWSCCGNTAVHSANRLLAAALPVNELAKVEQDMKLDGVVVPCAACFSRFMSGAHEMDDPEVAADLAAVVGRTYHGSVAVRNLVDLYYTEVGLDDLGAAVVRPFHGLRIACYYGCLLTRPPRVTLAEDPEYPTHMDDVVRALGCDAVEWNYKTDCCGAGLALCEQDVVIDLTRRILRDATACGADAVAVACPLCQINLDTRQAGIAKKYGGWKAIPVIYLSQLVGRAIGVEDAKLGLRKHMVDATAVMAQATRPSPRSGVKGPLSHLEGSPS
jgi:heterodisulfide reductase subunit B2